MYKVLIAEDEELIRKGIINIIDWEELGLEVVHTAQDGEEAVMMWEQSPVDIIITDINMPKRNGLDMLLHIRSLDKRVRFLILTGYDEFDYAKKAIRLDVEDYILKPIDEEQLEIVLKEAVEKLNHWSRNASEEEEKDTAMLSYLEGSITEREIRNSEHEHLSQLGTPPYLVVNMQIQEEDIELDLMDERDLFHQVENEAANKVGNEAANKVGNEAANKAENEAANEAENVATKESGSKIRNTQIVYMYIKEKLSSDHIPHHLQINNRSCIIILSLKEQSKLGRTDELNNLNLQLPSSYCEGYISSIQDNIVKEFGILTFAAISSPCISFLSLPDAYKEILKLNKYIMLYGYGRYINSEQVKDRKIMEIEVDTGYFQKLILSKDKDKAVHYLEDLFTRSIDPKTASIDSILELTIKTAMTLQQIKEEFKVCKQEKQTDLLDMIHIFFKSDSINIIISMFVTAVTELIDYLNIEDSCYTPVVKQIITEVRNHYKEEMNLKTLAHKYHMNTSYLGQIFQKEVGCTFAKYLSGVKISVAKDMILNTNKRIHDIAKEVGYPDTSYFYRKFKQNYGVSPASLRELKHY